MQETNGVRSQYRVCNFCEAMCGVQVFFDPNAPNPKNTIQILADKNDPFSKGSICPKAAALGPLYFDPDKLKHPLKKDGDAWVEISWDEAYALVESKIKAIRKSYGTNATGIYLGNPIVHNLGMMVFIKSFIKAVGSKNVFSASSMDQLPHMFAAEYMFGHDFRIPIPDIDRTDYILIMGGNPMASNGSLMSSAGVGKRLKDIRDRNGKVVVIDPRRTETAKVASEHHFIHPGSDVFLLLALLHIIFRDNKVNLGPLAQHVGGFEKLAPLVAKLSLNHVQDLTGISKGAIEGIASDYLSREKAVIYGRMGVSTQAHGGLCHWLINVINIVSGHFDRPGGMMFSSPAIELVRKKKSLRTPGRWSSRVRSLREFGGELPVSTMADEMLTEGEGQVRAFVSICGNPVLSSPNGKRLDEALAQAEFVVCIDNYINETSRHADVILPTPSGLEVDHYDVVFNGLAVSNNAKFSESFFPPGKDRPFDWQVLKELTKRLAPGGLKWFERPLTPRRLVNWALMTGPYGKLSSPKRWLTGLSLKKVIDSKHGIHLGPLVPRVPEGLATIDQKVHLADPLFLNRLNEILFDGGAKIDPEGEETLGEGEFRLIGRRHVVTNNTWMHQVELLSKSKKGRCTVLMNPEDAKSLGLIDREDVKVISRTGEVILPVEVTDTMMPRVVSIPHGFGHNRPGTRVRHAEANPGVSVNDITDHLRLDKLTNNAAFSGQRVKVEKI